MTVLLDEGVPKPLSRELRDHDVSTVTSRGWAGTKTGKLLNLIEEAGLGAFITCDQTIEKHQVLRRRSLFTLVLSTNNWPTMRSHVRAVGKALDFPRLGIVAKVECGIFIPRKFGKPK